MAATGNSFETPHACPFVALELDRDKRSDKPDYRHRCFAEPTPAPRSIAHQEAFCLSPSFAGCPIFQDWAVRAAARPTATGPAAPGAAAATDILATATLPPGASVEEHGQSMVDAPPPSPLASPPAEEWPEDVSVTAADASIAAAAAAATGMGPAIVAPPTFATTGWQDEDEPQNEQMGVFDAPPPDDEPHSSYGEPDAGYPEPPAAPAFVPPPAQPSSSDRSSAEKSAAAAAVPAFLAGRSARPTPTSSAADSAPPSRPTPPPAREEIVPSWEIDGRYGAEMPLDDGGGGGSRFDGILTAIAVVAILAIGVAAVLFLPGLLNKGSTTHTPAPSLSFAPASGLPSVAPSLIASAPPTSVPSGSASAAPTATPSPAGSPRSYRIKAGDSLARIANKFDTTIEAILAANPEITDPNNILVGQTIVIPQSATATPTETASP